MGVWSHRWEGVGVLGRVEISLRIGLEHNMKCSLFPITSSYSSYGSRLLWIKVVLMIDSSLHCIIVLCDKDEYKEFERKPIYDIRHGHYCSSALHQTNSLPRTSPLGRSDFRPPLSALKFDRLAHVYGRIAKIHQGPSLPKNLTSRPFGPPFRPSSFGPSGFAHLVAGPWSNKWMN